MSRKNQVLLSLCGLSFSASGMGRRMNWGVCTALRLLKADCGVEAGLPGKTGVEAFLWQPPAGLNSLAQPRSGAARLARACEGTADFGLEPANVLRALQPRPIPFSY